MYYSAGLIPARFLTLVAHLIVNIVILTWSPTENATNCLPKNASPMSLSSPSVTGIIVGMSVTIGMIGLELLAFLSGFTMFNNTSALLSTFSHSSAIIALSYFVLESWHCDWFWWIFAFGSVLPVLYDATIVFQVIYNKRY